MVARPGSEKQEVSPECDVVAACQSGIEPVDLDLLQIAQATRGGREPKIGELGVSEVGVSEVASQCRSLFAIKRIAQRLQGSVP